MSRVIHTGQSSAVRARRIENRQGSFVELTQLRSRPGGFEAAEARVLVPLAHVDQLVIAMVGLASNAVPATAEGCGHDGHTFGQLDQPARSSGLEEGF